MTEKTRARGPGEPWPTRAAREASKRIATRIGATIEPEGDGGLMLTPPALLGRAELRFGVYAADWPAARAILTGWAAQLGIDLTPNRGGLPRLQPGAGVSPVITLRLPAELVASVDELAGAKRSEWIREAIEQRLAAEGAR